MRRWLLVSLLLCSMFAGGAVARAEDDAFPAMPLDELGLPEVVVSTDGATLSAPASLDAGRYFLQVDNNATASVAVEFYRAPEGASAADLIPGFQDAAALDQPPPDFYDLLIAGGVTAEAGGHGQAVIDLPAGCWIAAAFVYGNGADGLLTQAVDVTGDIGDPDDPDSDIDLNFEDFSFDMEERVPAGDQVWELENDGEQPHFISIYSYGGELTEAAVNAALFDAYGTAPQPVDAARDRRSIWASWSRWVVRARCRPERKRGCSSICRLERIWRFARWPIERAGCRMRRWVSS